MTFNMECNYSKKQLEERQKATRVKQKVFQTIFQLFRNRSILETNDAIDHCQQNRLCGSLARY